MDNPNIIYAGFWRRFGAQMVDGILVLVIIAAASAMLLGTTGFEPEALANPQANPIPMWFTVLQFVVPILLISYFWKKFRATPGKMLFRCEVVDVNTHEAISLGKGVLRNLAYYVSMIPLFLGYFWVIWDPKKQGFHDKIAKTVVLVKHPSPYSKNDESQKSIEELVEESR